MLFQCLLSLEHQRLGQSRFKRTIAIHRLEQYLLELGIQAQHIECTGSEPLLGNRTAQGDAYQCRQFIGVLLVRRG